MKILHFSGHCINRLLYSDLVCCRTDTVIFIFLYSYFYKVSALLLSYLYNKPQRQLSLNHIESKCYHQYNLLPDNGRPFVTSVSILSIPVSPLNMWSSAHPGLQNEWAAWCFCDRAAGNL